MTQPGGSQWAQLWTAVSAALASAIPTEEHLAVEAVVAYVDGELSIAAHERATRHLAGCTLCTAEVAAQRQARAAVRSATSPAMSASLLAALHAIPHSVDLPPGPDVLAVGEDGQFVVAQRPLAPLGLSAPLGSGERLGSSGLAPASTTSGPVAGDAAHAPGSAAPAGRTARRVAQGAGVVVSGLVLGALALSLPGSSAGGGPTVPGSPGPAAESGPAGPVSAVVPARFEFEDRDEEQPLTVAGRPQR